MHHVVGKALGVIGLDGGKGQPDFVTKIIFPTVDMKASIAFYEKLGFSVVSYDEAYAWVQSDGRELFHLSWYPELDRGANRAAGYFHVPDVEVVHERWTATVSTTDPLGDRPWGMREFSVTDPSGNLLRVGQNL